MKVLVVHNRYSSRAPSGENVAVQDEVLWLRAAGVDVTLHEVTNDDVFGGGPLRRAGQAVWSTWSLPAQREAAAVVDRLKPDVVHVHNLFPLLTASVPWAALRRRVPVVWTVHNYRALCVIGTYFRDGEDCRQCRPGWRLPGIRYGCYGGSAGASALVTGATSVFRALARRRITAVAVSHGVARWLTDTAGFPAERVKVKHNAVAKPLIDTTDAAKSRTFVLAGYLIEHKGIALLLEAWRATEDLDAELRILGDGPMADDVRRAADADPRITYVGQVPAEQVATHLAAARAVVVPSTWQEPCPRSAMEALAAARPVITTGLGGLGEIVDPKSGWVTGTDPQALTDALIAAARSDAAVADRAAAAERRHQQLFSPEATTSELISIYEEALT
jgi:glycosyltransferase involved in cell wall biosynthesis